MTLQKPLEKPANPNFSSGPCSKHPGYSVSSLKDAPLGRSHRASVGLTKLQDVLQRSRMLLNIPDEYHIAIVPASDTGAMEMAMWSMLGARPLTVLAWESFGQDWVKDITQQLKLEPEIRSAPYGGLPSTADIPKAHDIIFTWNGTTSGVRVANADWIAGDHEGVVICDATSAVFAQPIDWHKLDVVTWSWQKALGGEAAHGMLILSPKAVARLETYTPSWPLPKLFRMTKDGKLNAGLFKGSTINTPSMLCVEDCLQSLKWAQSIGGLGAMQARSNESLETIRTWVARSDWAEFLCKDPAFMSNTSVCLKFSDAARAQFGKRDENNVVKALCALLEQEEVAYDIAGYRNAPPGLRIWCGATVDPSHVKALLPWLDWAYAKAIQ